MVACFRLVYMEEDDGLLHFYWKDRTTNNNAEDLDLILFPDDAELVHVPQCSTGRVVMLQFKSSPQKHFFWLQDKNTDRDQIILQQTNALINQGQRLGDDDDTGHFDDDVRME
ncbi:hypothetical protein BGW38_004658 [Lunasporangiospora selenospora]|uniref:Pru domain-containing protein n=1 Tax=Lunasporangiospora selenospora TaxID=979761 RepID=A0A9P6G0E0_9FUNG|nr:hypothetical protein BGW38_004658 [Lunasporangiospora selenospora]